MIKIPFNKPFLTGKEMHYMYDAAYSGQLSGNGKFTRKCHSFFEERYGFERCLLTTSCTDALEMAALLIDVKPGDEIIMPSYTFVSTANAFALRGANIVFADSHSDHPGLNEDFIEELITENTKALVPVHYAGMACEMDKIMDLAERYDLYVIEDAAHAVNNYYTGSDDRKRPLGSIGHLATFSFHETKNIISGEGGMLVVNNKSLEKKAEIIWEKGTNRVEFFRGQIDKYEWVDLGSSFLPSDLIAAFLWAQLENLEKIQEKRIKLWTRYHDQLSEWALSNNIQPPIIPSYSSNNGHIYYLVCDSKKQRDKYIDKLREKGIQSIFHYQSLHNSKYYRDKHDGRKLVQAEGYSDGLLRLPLFYELTSKEQQYIIDEIKRV